MSLVPKIGLEAVLYAIATAVLLTNASRISAALRDLFRGGPRPPSHPIPAEDSHILNRRRRKTVA
jgi:hypothetical protein